MVVTYLEKIREKLQRNRIHISTLLSVKKSEYRENEAFINLLEENNDPSFESFTPRTVNGFNKRKIEELQETQKGLTNVIEELNNELKEIDAELAEVTEVIRVAKESFKN